MRLRHAPVLAPWCLALLAVGCASREVPAQFPHHSAASPQAKPAKVANVTRALKGDPPLPDEDTSGWSGLAPSKTQGHAGHGAHHHGP